MRTRTIYLTKLPPGKFDFIANLPTGSEAALRREIEKRFGIVGREETVETNVLFLRTKSPNAPGLRATTAQYRPSESRFRGEFRLVNGSLGGVDKFLESELGVPVVDQTSLNGRYDVNLKWNYQNDPQHENLKQAVLQQLGLELVPGVAPTVMIVFEKAQ